jgi:hypothetical protein
MLKLIALFIIAAFASFKAQACSISVNAQYVKNLMASAAANEYGIGLDKATKITFSDYSKMGIGLNRATGCPLKIRTKAMVVINYRPNLTERCELSVNVSRTENLKGPAKETFAFSLPASSCETVSLPVIIFP